MKVDWKEVSKSEGYRSLKAKYIEDVQNNQSRARKGFRSIRDKKELYGYFKRAIYLAMKYANKWDMSLSEVLDYWESKRSFCWLNFYQPCYVERLKPSL